MTIDKHFIESAIMIREEYLHVVEKLDSYQIDSKKLGEYLLRVADDLTQYSKETEKKNTVDIEDVQKHLLKKFSDIEDECSKLTNKTKTLNDRIEELQKEEWNLYNVIVEKYPDMSAHDIRKILSENITR